MRYRRLATTDLASVLALQDANLYDALDPVQRQDGYLSVRFDGGQFAAMAADVAVIVAHENAHVHGYLCASSNDYNAPFPLLASMLVHARPLSFLGRPLGRQRTFVYGPVCVARADRGQGLLRGMYDRLRDELAGEFDAGVLFIAKGNPRSLSAHDRLGASIVGEFVYDARAFWILAFPIPQPRFC